MKKYYNSFCIILTVSVLSACAPALIFGGGKILTTSVVQEKSLGSAIDDSNIWSKIRIAFIKEKLPANIINNVSVKVLEGRVLLTGRLVSPEDKMKIVKIVWSQTGVREVNDEIEIVDNNYLDVKTLAKDSWITSTIKSKLLLNRQIKSINYTVETLNCVVYLFGIAQNEEELNLVTELAREVNGVEKVLSFVRVKNSPLRNSNINSSESNNVYE